MGMREQMTKKLAQATCDKVELNRKFLQMQKSLKEAEKAISGTKKKDKK